MPLPDLYLKKDEDRRLLAGHLWIYSNEIDTGKNPLSKFTAGELIHIKNHRGHSLGTGYINPNTLLAARLLTRYTEILIDVDFFKKRLSFALQLRNQCFTKPYYRLVFSESDGLPGVIIDRFAQYYVVQITTAGMEKLTPLLIEAMIVELKPQGILLRNNTTMRALENLPLIVECVFGDVPQTIFLEENNCRFQTSLWEGQKTGWFYDHRFNRAKLNSYATNKKVLDVFSYMGSFGVHAAKFGATHVTCIDSSNTALNGVQKNAELNAVASIVTTIKQDAFESLQQLIEKKQFFDLIILDPPAFIKRKKDQAIGIRAYTCLNELALNLLNDGGILLTASCSMHLDQEIFLNLIRKAGLNTQTNLRILEQLHQGPDHPIHPAIPETNYLKGFIIMSNKY